MVCYRRKLSSSAVNHIHKDIEHTLVVEHGKSSYPNDSTNRG